MLDEKRVTVQGDDRVCVAEKSRELEGSALMSRRSRLYGKLTMV